MWSFKETILLNYLLDDHDVIKFLTHSLTPPLTEEVRSCFYARDWCNVVQGVLILTLLTYSIGKFCVKLF